MHPSLSELNTEARRASSPTMARGILAEAQELMRNALDHGESEPALALWFSHTLQEWALSPAVEEITGGSRLLFTGPVARCDAIPTDTVTWFIIGEAPDANEQLRELVDAAALPVGDLPAPAPQAHWDAAASAAASQGDADKLAYWVDAGYLDGPAVAEALLAPSLAHLPPMLRLAEGLPDYDTPVDVRGSLMDPVVAVARWAGLLAGARGGNAPHRLGTAQHQGILTEDEAEALTQAWSTGLSMELRAWRHGTWGQEETMRSLPSLDRSAYGAAARLVSVALRSIAGRHGIALP
ncbi:MAG: putative nucleotidyltransferase substrate binding domain-containing protein [Corynebacterium sp.]|uniref:putative nucleotidyltransferase substrate binding domain-containing protein n=1 Tax=Corynebacterium sp. TaxID=1720 RepID=UPI0026E0D552|nr:putative nucleotidyltransferase substrate binding domain-containing protein [Corynebacterium sp.]MDO5669649.1 putative nucleotidyltransferase substrate binding domain-containing protein [Corynebacterium sp.]